MLELGLVIQPRDVPFPAVSMLTLAEIYVFLKIVRVPQILLKLDQVPKPVLTQT